MSKKFFIFFMLLLSYAPIATSANIGGNGANYLFVGNPGAGKSTLINSIVGQEICEAGLAKEGHGLTRLCNVHDFQGSKFIDTPGLADNTFQADAASEIEKALKQGGKYHLFFVLQLADLRVRLEDVASMNLIMDAINSTNVQFNVIINKLTRKELNELLKPDNEVFLKVLGKINSGRYKTQNVTLIPLDRAMEDGLRELINLDAQTKDNILNHSLSMNINKDKIKNIEWNKLEKYIKESERKTAEFMRKIEQKDGEILETRAELERHKEALRNAKGGFWSGFFKTLGIVFTIAATAIVL